MIGLYTINIPENFQVLGFFELNSKTICFSSEPLAWSGGKFEEIKDKVQGIPTTISYPASSFTCQGM